MVHWLGKAFWLFLWALYLLFACAQAQDVPSEIKGRLARLLFQKDLHAAADVRNVTVEWEARSSEVRFEAGHSAILRPSEKSFFYHANSIAPLHVQHAVPLQPFYLGPKKELINSKPPCLIEMTSWRNTMYIVSCYEQGYCEVSTSLDDLDFTLRQTISVNCIPAQLKFFIQDDDLFLVVASEFSKIYGWTGTYFDAEDILETPGTRGLEIFSFEIKVVLVFGQDSEKEAYSKVFVRSEGIVELVQLLDTDKASRVLHYQVDTAHGQQNYILALSKGLESPVYWWNGRKFSHWMKIVNVGEPDKGVTGVINSEPFVFVISKEFIFMYHAKTTELTLVRTIKSTGDIMSLSVEDPNLVLLIAEPSGDSKIVVISLHVLVVPDESDDFSTISCMKGLLEKVKQRGKLLQALKEKQQNVLSTTESIHVKSLSTKGPTVFNDVKIKKLVVNPAGAELLATPAEIKKALAQTSSKFISTKKQIDETHSSRKKIIVEGDLYVKNLKANNLDVKIMNGRKMDMDDFLSLTKDQKITGPVRIGVIYAEKLNITHLNSHSPKDLLRRKAKSQVFTGNLSVGRLSARNIRFGEISKVNGIPFKKFVTKRSGIVTGTKTVEKFRSEALNVSEINNEPSKQWIRKMLPPISSSGTDQSLNTDYLSVRNLTVEYINGLPAEDVFDRIRSKLNTPDDFRAKNLTAKYINGILVDDFLTQDGHQNVTSKIEIPYLRAEAITFETINNATREQVARALKNMFQQGESGVREVRFEVPVRVEGDFNVSTIHFMKTIDIANSTVDLSSADGSSLPLWTNDATDIVEDENRTQDNADGNNDNLKKKNQTGNLEVDPFYPQQSKSAENKVKKIVIRGDVKVRNVFKVGAINGEDVPSTLSNLVLLDDDSLLDHAHFHDLTVHSLQTSTVNDQEITTREKRSLIVNGSLTLPEIFIVCEEGSVCKDNIHNLLVKGNMDGYVNKVDLTAFSHSVLSKIKDQEITGNYSIGTLNANSLNVTTINGIHSDNLLYTDAQEEQVVYSDLIFQDLGALGNLSISTLNCTLEQLAKINLSEITEFESVEVVGNVTWVTSRPQVRGALSYMFENLVTTNGNHIITAPVLFKGEVQITSVTSEKHINNVDLEFIAKDAILSSVRKQVVKAESSFKGSLTAEEVKIKENISVDSIDGVDIVSFNATLVRKDDTRIVTGLKIMPKGLVAHELTTNTGEVHGMASKNLVFIEDFLDDTNVRVLPPTVFNSLTIVANMTVQKVNDIELDNFMGGLISLSESETLPAKIKFKGSLKLGSLKTDQVNDLIIEDTILCNGEYKTVEGPVEFLERVDVTGNIDATSVYGVNLTEMYQKSVKVDENVTISGSVIFEQELTVNGNMDVETVNQCDIADMYSREMSFNPEYIISESSIATAVNLRKIDEIIEHTKLGKIFKYLDQNSTVEFEMENIKSTSVLKTKTGVTEIQVYGMAKGFCGLPSDTCLCPRQYSVTVGPDRNSVSAETNRTYRFYDSILDVAVQVSTNSVSYSSRCQIQEGDFDEITQMRWAQGNTTLTEGIILRSGYLSDVKFFKLGDSVFIVLAFFFSGNVTDSHSLKVSVYELQTHFGILQEVDSLPAQGAMTLDILWASPSYILVIGNIRSDEAPLDSVHSEVYRFNERINKFEFLKKIRTHGVLNLKAIRIKKESFIFIVQKYPWPLLAYKYSYEHENYYFSEKLYQKAGFYSVTAIPSSETSPDDVYVGVVYMNDRFTVFKYKHIEGLTEEITVKQKNVQVLQHFFSGSEQFILAASPTGTSNIYRVVTQG